MEVEWNQLKMGARQHMRIPSTVLCYDRYEGEGLLGYTVVGTKSSLRLPKQVTGKES
jgi:hypothetical protein